MSRPKKPAAPAAAQKAAETELSMPQAGGAFYRSRTTGELLRDRDYEQAEPEPADPAPNGEELAGDGTGTALPPVDETGELRTAGGAQDEERN